MPTPEPEEVAAAVLTGKKMPTEKVIAWLVRIVILLTIIVGGLVQSAVDDRLLSIEDWRSTHADWAIRTEQEFRNRINAQDITLAVSTSTTAAVNQRLDRIERKLDELVEQGR